MFSPIIPDLESFEARDVFRCLESANEALRGQQIALRWEERG